MTLATAPGQLTHGVEDATTLLATHPNPTRWMEYVVQYISDSTHFNEGYAYDLLAKYLDANELLVLSTSLPDTPNMEICADTFQKLLYEKYPAMRKATIEIWLKLGKTPTEVYSLLSIRLEEPLPAMSAWRSGTTSVERFSSGLITLTSFWIALSLSLTTV